MFQTIRNKFVLFFILLVTFTIILIGIISDYTIQKQITLSVAETFLDDLKDEIAKVNTFLGEVKSDLDLLSGETSYNLGPAIESGNKDDVSIWLSQLENKFIKYMEVRRIYSQIKYIDTGGEEIIRIDFDGKTAGITTEELLDKDNRAFIDTMKLNDGMLYVSPLNLNRKRGKIKVQLEPIISFAKPVFNDSGDKAGILIISVLVNEFLKKLNYDNSGILTLVNKDGYFLSHPDESLEFGFDIAGSEGNRLQTYYPDQAGKILSGGSGYVDTGKGWVTTWFYWFYNPGDELLVYQSLFPNSTDKTNYWVLIKSGSKKELIATLMTMRGVMLGISLLFFAITCPLILFFGLRLTRSMSKLKKAMEGFEKGEGLEGLDIKSTDEFSELTRSFVTMSESLYCTKMSLSTEFQRLKNLVEFSRLVGEEISEKECFVILIKFLARIFHFDKIIAVSFNNSENIAEVLISYESINGELPVSTSPFLDLKVTKDARLCRALRSGHKFVVSNVESDYRCQYQEVTQDQGSYACFPVVTGGAVLGWVHLVSLNKDYFSEERCFMIESYINTIAPSINSIRLLNAHRKMSVLDPLTGLYNRRFLEEILERQIAIAERYKQSLSVIMLDIDHFKKFNDSHGHTFGDNTLKLISKIILMTVRDSDTVARYGGEEFIAVLPNTDIDFACILAEKIRKAVEQYDITDENGVIEGVTISLGVSSFPSVAFTMKELIDTADSALYQSKAKGRNMVTSTEKSIKIVDNIK
jgi:diguanylate cyclase (GGDEF)-like protein